MTTRCNQSQSLTRPKFFGAFNSGFLRWWPRSAAGAGLLAGLLLWASGVPAATIHVPAQYSSIQAAINAANPGDTIIVASGAYSGVLVTKALTLQGANVGVPGCGSRGSESSIAGGAGVAVTVLANNVTVDGFALSGALGVYDSGFVGVAVQNNAITAAAIGIDITNVTTTALATVSLGTNCVMLTSQLAGSTPTVGIGFARVSGSQSPTIISNSVSGAYIGYVLYNANAAVPTLIQGASVTGALVGIAVYNVDPAGSGAYNPSSFAVSCANLSGFTGGYPGAFQAGVYVFTGGGNTAAAITGSVCNSTILGTGNISADSSGVYVGDFSTSAGARQTITVQNCVISNNLNRGIYVRGSNAVATISQSTIAGNGYDPYGSGGNYGFGIIAQWGATSTVSQCFFIQPATNNLSYPVYALAAFGPPVPTFAVNGCSLTNNGNTNALAHLLSASLDASANWWGTNSAAGVAALAGANVDYTPWLDNGTDTDSVTPGFQGDFSILRVAAASPQTGATGRIQEAINLSSGSTVLVEAGIYVENDIINKSLTLTGAGQGNSIIYPSSVNPNCGGAGGGSLCAGGVNMMLVQADNVTISGFTLNGDNPNLTSSVVYNGAQIDARNGIIEDYNLPNVVTNLVVCNVTVTNVYLRGIYASSGGSFNFHDNTVGNVGADQASVAIFNFGGSGVMKNNTVLDSGDALSCNWSTGTEIVSNTVMRCMSGVHTDNNDGSGGSPDLLQGNVVLNGPLGSYGVWVFVPYGVVSVTGNTISNVSVGLALFAQGGPGGSAIFSGNNVIGNMDPNGAGAYVTTDTYGYGSFNVEASFTGNSISNNATALDLESDPGYTDATGVTNNVISGNSLGVYDAGSGTEVSLNNNSFVANTVNGNISGELYIQNTALTASSATLAGCSLTLGPGAVLNGNGTVGNLTQDSGSKLSPGASPGQIDVATNVVWAGGAEYDWEINQANGTQGVDPGWDWLNITNTLTITATSGNQFNVKVTTLTLADVAGNMANFDCTADYVWPITTAMGGISGFAANVFNVDLTGFANPVFGGAFAITSGANSVNLTFTHNSTPQPVVYVDHNYTGLATGTIVKFPYGGGGADHVVGFDAFATVQAGADAVAAGGVVNVAAGTYAEDLVIGQPLSLLGPNANINPNTGSRVAEAVIIPATSDPDPYSQTEEVVVYVATSNVKIAGITVDGSNPSIPGNDHTNGVLVGGVVVNAGEGIVSWEGVGSITLSNNIVKDTTYSGVDFYNYVNDAATANNYIQNNLFQNIGYIPYGFGIGVLLYNNFYATVSGNVLNARVGIQTGNFYNSNPGTTACIVSNTINSTAVGIFHNLQYGSASPFTINGNVITAQNEAGGTKWDGLLVSSIQGGVGAVIASNTITATPITQTTAGYEVWNVPTTAGISVCGGSVSGANYGVWLNNYHGYHSSGAASMLTINGVNISGSTLAGVYVQDDPLSTHQPQLAIVTNNCAISSAVSGAVGVLVQGGAAQAEVKNNTSSITGNAFGIEVNAGSALIQSNDLTGNAIAALYVQNGATVDAGNCTGVNTTGLGISLGGNNLSGYGFDNATPWAITNGNSSVQPNVLADHNNFGAAAGQNIRALIYDHNDNAAYSTVVYSQIPQVLSCPPTANVVCPASIPAGATTLPQFIAQGGSFSASAATVSFSDTPHPVGNGSVTRTYTVTDLCGVYSQCNQTINVSDTTPPTPTCPGNIVVNADLGQCSKSGVTWVASATDNCTVTNVVSVPPSGSTFAVGTNVVTVTATDQAGNSSSCSFTVAVLDAQLPSVTCQNISLTFTGAVLTITPAQVFQSGSDNCGVVHLDSVMPNAFDCANIGLNSVTLTVDDGHGNTNTCVATVTVIDGRVTPPPVAYVDANYVGLPACTRVSFPAVGGSGTNFIGYNAFGTIQAAVNAVAANGTIQVAAGTYPGSIVVTKSLSLLGAQAGQNAGARFAAFTTGANGPKASPSVESIITAAVTDPGDATNDTLHIMADNVTIDGFVVDGNNPALAQGSAVQVSGINTDSRRAIETASASGSLYSVNYATVRNNIIQNFAQRGVELATPSDTSPATSGSLISGNVIRNFGLDGILIAYNAYSDVISNTVVMPSADGEAGIWLQDFPNNGAAPKTLDWSHNTVTVCQDAYAGLWVNLFHAPAATINIHDNTVNAAAGVTGADDYTFGIYLSTLQNGTTANLSNNVVGASGGQFARGIALWNVPTTTPTTVSGGTVGNALKGVSLHYDDPYFGPAGASFSANVKGVSVSGTGIGAWVNASNSASFTVQMQICGNASVNACNTGIAILGGYASAKIHDNLASITGNGIGIDVNAGSALIQSNNLTGNTIAGISVENGATVDAGNCTGVNTTGLGICTGGNILSGYGFDNAAPWAITNGNSSVQPNVLADHNNFGTAAGQNIGSLIYDHNDNAAYSAVVYSQIPQVLTCPPTANVVCPASIPAGATTLSQFIAQGGSFSASAATVSFSDTPHPVGNGSVTRTYTVTDLCGVYSQCNQTINVSDTTPPTPTCPGNIVVNADLGQCSKSGVTWVASATDNCTVTNVVSVPPSGSTFAVGTNIVTVTATDQAGNSGSCSFTVAVLDTQLPTINCPADKTVNVLQAKDPYFTGTATAGSVCGAAAVSYTDEPNGLTNCDATGVIYRTWQAVDAYNNTNTCLQNITVIDTNPPAIVCPANLVTNAALGLCSQVVTFAPTATDTNYFQGFEDPNYVTGSAGNSLDWTDGGSHVSRAASGTLGIPASGGAAYGLIDSTVPAAGPNYMNSGAYTFLDGINSAFGIGYRVAVDVYINLSDPSVVNATPTTGYGWDLSTAAADAGANYLRDFIFHTAAYGPTGVVVAADNGSNDNPDARRNDLLTLPNHAVLSNTGWYTFEWVMRAANGALAVDLNVRSAAGALLFSQTLSDPSDVISDVGGSPYYTWFIFVFTDKLAMDNTLFEHNLPVVSTPASGSTFAVGATTVTNVATDSCGNSNVCTFTVTVQDTQAPNITCPVTVTNNAALGHCYATSVNLGTPVTADNCAVATVSSNAPIQFPAGSTPVTWTVVDVHNNSNTCVQTVVVIDTQLPTITCPVNVTNNAALGLCYATSVNLGQPVTGDNCGVATVSSNAPGQYPAGTTLVTWTVVDVNNNTNTCQQTVVVKDTQLPSITCPVNLTNNAALGLCYATNVNLGQPVTADNCAVSTVSSNAPSHYPVGTTLVTWTVVDVNNNTNTCQQTVVIKDTQLPIITCPVNVTNNAALGLCYATNVNLGQPITSDNCAVSTVSSNAPSHFPVGTTLVTWTVVDVNNNTNSCQQTVVVVSTQLPSITCPVNVTNNAALGLCYATNVNLGQPITSDNCAVSTVSSNAPSHFPVGTTLVTWSVVDVNNNTNACQQTVIIRDIEPPVIICPANIISNALPGLCYATNVLIGAPVASDNCGVASVTNDFATRWPSSFIPAGENIVIWTAVDIHSNASECVQLVSVADTQPPTVICPPNLVLSVDPGQCFASISTNVLGFVTFFDSCGVPENNWSYNAPSRFPPGTNIVTWTVTDFYGNTNSCQQMVIVLVPLDAAWEGGQLILSWPLACGTLEQSPTLSPSAWTDCTNAVTPIGGAGYQVTLTPTNKMMFYRLKNQTP